MPVEGSIEDNLEALENWGIRDQFPCDKMQIFRENILLIDTQNKGEKTQAILGCCGMANQPRNPLWIRNFLMGFLGLGIYRMFALMWVTDVAKAKNFLEELGSLQDVDFVIFQHGPPLSGKGINSRLKSAKCSRSIFVF
mmetsp:Transcript_35654/g.68850  ORF Transcript_35654/g.68850 Transcript_35654/m.68850 type:complete len:139 (-) Transcript_35654:331-747(-)